MINPYKPMVGHLTLRQFQTMQTRMGEYNELERMAFLYRQLVAEIELDEESDDIE